MAARQLDVTVGPWAQDKLRALGEYLEFYNTVLKNQTWLRGTIFIDGFAGAGFSKIRDARKPKGQASLLVDDEEQQEFVSGSPRVALELRTPFRWHLFIERDPIRVAELEKLKSEFPDKHIQVREGDAATVIRETLARRKDWKQFYRGVAFLDPFGTHLEWATVEALAETGAFEVLINFPLQMAIQRLLPNDGNLDAEWRQNLDAYFGTPEWYDLVYEEAGGLFGSTLKKKEEYGVRLLRLYSDRLEAAFGYVSPPKLISNTKGHPLYYLIWAGPNSKGRQGAEHILSRGHRVPSAKSSKPTAK